MKAWKKYLVFPLRNFATTFNSDAPEIVIPFAIEYPENELTITIPKGGDKKKLLELSEKNANYFIEEIRNKERLKLSKNTDQIKLLEQLQLDLQLSRTTSTHRVL